mgnify:CR=1 FL=1
MTKILDQFDSVAEVPSQKARIIRFTFKTRPAVYVVWGRTPTRVDLTPYISRAKVQLTFPVTRLDKNDHPVYLPKRTALTRSIPVDETPVFVFQGF